MNTTENTFQNEQRSPADVLQRPLEALKNVVPADAYNVISNLPQQLETEIRERPYRTLGIAVGVGIGIGALASSRVTRFLVMNLGGFALTEFARRGALRYVDQMLRPR